MIEVPIPQDIREFEPKFIGPLTLRKFICLLAMACVVYGGYYIEKAMGIEPMDQPWFMIPALPLFFVGWVEPYGMKFEKFIAKAYEDNFANPSRRLYQVDNLWNVIEKEREKDDIAKARAAARAEGKTYTPPKKTHFSEKPSNKLPAELKPYK